MRNSIVNSRKGKFLLLFTCIIIIINVLVRAPFYRGDGELKRNGFFSFGYRYEVTFQSFIVDKALAKKVYSFSGVPSHSYSLRLEVKEARPPEDYDEILVCNMQTEIIFSSDDETLVHIGKPDVESGKSNQTVDNPDAKHRTFHRVELDKYEQYQLSIAAVPINTSCLPAEITPVLRGGPYSSLP